MIRFLIRRPIAVIMAFTALFILGVVTYFSLPVSLLPSIAIPEMTVQVSGGNMSAREVENSVVRPIRQQLMQVSSLRDIESEVRDEVGIIRLRFDYGVDTDLAFIEVNEKIDAAMGALPRDVMRPRVIKASATDIPVFLLHMTLKSDVPIEGEDDQSFIDMSEFVQTVLKRRLEQLQQVAMADISGTVEKVMRITPSVKMLEMTGLTEDRIKSALSSHNVQPGAMTVRDGYYEYNIKFSSLLRNAEDVENLYIKENDRVYQLKDIARVELVSRKEKGYSTYNGKRAITLALIKQSSENMEDMKREVQEVLNYFKDIYPQIEFSVSQNQTELLDYTIANLQQNLLVGFVLICIVAFLFLGDRESPIVISFSMIVSLIISLLFFYLFGLSLNIISISGLILALGMMIDSSIVVTDNIAQHRERLGDDRLEEACERGAGEVILPVLSSSLTTVSVFVPLVFMSGIAGALFKDEALSVTIGLGVAYLVGIFLLPVIYFLLYQRKIKRYKVKQKVLKPIENEVFFYTKWYDWVMDAVFAHKFIFTILTLLMFPLCVWLFLDINKEKMPAIEQCELMVNVDWGENIHLDENRRRMYDMVVQLSEQPMEFSSFIGKKDFLLNKERDMGRTEGELYLKVSDPGQLSEIETEIRTWIRNKYPMAVLSFSPPENIFEKVFDNARSDLIICMQRNNRFYELHTDSVRLMKERLGSLTGIDFDEIAFNEMVNISIDRQKLILYGVDESVIREKLKSAFQDNQFAVLRSYVQYLPILMSGEEKSIGNVLEHEMIQIRSNINGKNVEQDVPLKSFVKVKQSEELKNIVAGRDGEYIPFAASHVDDPQQMMEKVKTEFRNDKEWECNFIGGYFENKKMFDDLLVVMLVSLLLMYFILAAQFESLVQPLLVLLEIPIDVAAALLILKLTGHSLNLMSAIGMVVTCGIVINDSILKLDVINQLRREGMPLLKAIHMAGHRRLRAILMTTLTTVLGMAPLLFSSDMGSELQKPLAIAMIGSMIIGTLVSLFIMPLAYWFVYRKKEVA